MRILGPVLLLFLACPAFGETDLVAARRAFLTSRDAPALEAALGGSAVDRPGAIADVRLAMMAARPDASGVGTSEGTGYDAIPDVVARLRRLDLDGAEALLPRIVEPRPPAALDRWLRALVATRRGDDLAALRILADRSGPVRLAEEDAFRLALVGAALAEDDRLFLAGVAMEALLEAAADGDLEHAERLARRLAALDRDLGAEALCLAARAWERRGQVERGEAVLNGLESGWIEQPACLRLERAVWRWRRGRVAEARALVGGLVVPAADAWLAERLQQLLEGGRPPPIFAAAEVHVNGAHRPAYFLAQLATAAGVETRPAEIEARALALAKTVDDAGFSAHVLAERDLLVLSLAGSTAAADLALAQDVPFLFYRILPRGDTFAEVPVLVRARDPSTGFYLAETADLSTRGQVPPSALGRGRILVALAPKHETVAAAARKTVAGRLGARILQALDAAGRGDLVAADTPLAGAADDETALPAYGAYRGWLMHRRSAFPQAQALVLPLLEATPPDPFAHMVAGQAAWGRRKLGDAARYFDLAQGAAPRAATIARTRYLLHLDAGDGEDAMAAIDEARRLAPLDVLALYSRGITRYRIGQVDAARADLTRASDRRPESRDMTIALARLELDAKRPVRALEIVARFRARVPGSADDEKLSLLERMAEERLVRDARTLPALRPLLESRHPETRLRAVYTLSGLQTDEAEALLRPRLDDKDKAVRVAALREYTRPWLRKWLEDDAALGRRILELLRKDPSGMVRGAATWSLKHVRRPWAAQALAEVLEGSRRDSDAYVRVEAAGALIRHDGPVARKALIEALEDENIEVRKAAVRVLFRIAATYMGYDAEAPAEERKKAVDRWRAWAQK